LRAGLNLPTGSYSWFPQLNFANTQSNLTPLIIAVRISPIYSEQLRMDAAASPDLENTFSHPQAKARNSK
jgi:hypothetical protein